MGKDVAFYSIPHCFKFNMFKGKCIMQYKLFSSFKQWLPEAPEVSDDYDVESIETEGIQLAKFATIGGEDLFLKELGILNVTTAIALKEPHLKKRQDSFYSMIATITSINDVSIFQKERNNRYFLLEDENIPKQNLEDDFKVATEVKIRSDCNNNKGFVYWLRSTRRNLILPSLNDFSPKLISINHSVKLKHKFESAANSIVTVSKHMLQMINDKKIVVSNENEFSAVNFTQHILIAEEFNFFNAMALLGEDGLLSAINNHILGAPKWNPIMISDEYEQDLVLYQEQQVEALQLAKSMCVKKGHDSLENTEIMSRHGLDLSVQGLVSRNNIIYISLQLNIKCYHRNAQQVKQIKMLLSKIIMNQKKRHLFFNRLVL